MQARTARRWVLGLGLFTLPFTVLRFWIPEFDGAIIGVTFPAITFFVGYIVAKERW